LDRFYGALRDYADVAPTSLAELADSSYYKAFVEAMNDDFNTRVALAGMFDLVRDLNNAKNNPELARNLAGQLKAFGLILGVLQENPEVFLHAGSSGQIAAADVERLVAERIQAKADKQYARADEIRKELLAAGVVLEDSRDGTTQWRRESA
jgi:cysteinyl-tRNA synthetase